MKFFKKSIIGGLVAVSLILPIQANAGFIGKVVKGGALIAAGVILYKVAKKLNIGSVTQNLTRNLDNTIPYLEQNTGKIPEVIKDVEKILNSPELTPDKGEVPANYIILSRIIQTHFDEDVDEGPWKDYEIDSPHIPKKENKQNADTVIAVNMREDEKLLERNMVAAGYGNKPDGYKAFHIATLKNNAYSALISLDININSAINGVYLPIEMANQLKDSAEHNDTVYQVIKGVYSDTKNKIAVENALRKFNYDLTESIKK